jgi:intracellular septation protein
MSIKFFLYTIIEFGPLTIFFFVSTLFGFYQGATALVISVFLTTIFSIIYFKRVSYFSLILSAFIFFSGLATIYFHNPIFMVLEYTVANLVFAFAQLYGHFKNSLVLKTLFGHMFAISDHGWRRLNFNWGMMFLITAIVNQLFWYFIQNENYWVVFRVASTAFIFFFGMWQFRISRDERLEGSSPWGLRQ